MTGYCNTCDSDKEYTLKALRETFNVKDIKVRVYIKVAICNKCNNEIYIRGMSIENDIAVFDAYKLKVGLLTSESIKEIREVNNLTQDQMAKVLNIGTKNINRYENGSIQDRSIDTLIKMLAFLGVTEFEKIRDFDYNYH